LILDSTDEGVDLMSLLRALGQRDFLQVYCEGGARLATSLLKNDLIDRLELHYGPKMTGGGPSIGELGVDSMDEARSWTVTERRQVGTDLLVSLERPS
jgi:diaminohydroxyphosphoribosylaminopyrimidine deaminase/5-amino-6-(5-phosphoribosylamino)uracil reductase